MSCLFYVVSYISNSLQDLSTHLTFDDHFSHMTIVFFQIYKGIYNTFKYKVGIFQNIVSIIHNQLFQALAFRRMVLSPSDALT